MWKRFHRKWAKRELSLTIGRSIVNEFGFRLLCHDAEGRENLVYLGKTKGGYEVEVNRLVIDPYLFIYVNFMSNLFNGSGGLSAYRSIRYNHESRQLMEVLLGYRIDPTRDPCIVRLMRWRKNLKSPWGNGF